MAGLKQLRSRIRSVKSTQKITKAMQLVSASKLAKVRSHIINSQHYVEAVHHMMEDLLNSENLIDLPEKERIFLSTSNDRPYLLIVITSERGLCGIFNSVIIKQVKSDILNLEKEGKKIKLIIVGKKGYDSLKADYADYIENYFMLPKSHDDKLILQIKDKIMNMVSNHEASSCYIYFNKFKNAMTQIPTTQQILPVILTKQPLVKTEANYEYEGKNIVGNLINLYINSQINYALLQSRASEEGARMTAMENATKNAKEIINKLTLKLNRSRQAMITNELIEIISGAEAV